MPKGGAVGYYRRLRPNDSMQLLSLRCADRAVFSTSAAFKTFVCIDHVLAVNLFDAFNGAVFSTSAATDAFIIDFICH